MTEPPIRASAGGYLRGRRELCLVLGYTAMAAVGLGSLLSGDALGAIYLGAAAAGIGFLHGRVLSSAIWAGVLVQGWLAWQAGSAPALVLVAAGAGGVAVALWPEGRRRATGERPIDEAAVAPAAPPADEPELGPLAPALVALPEAEPPSPVEVARNGHGLAVAPDAASTQAAAGPAPDPVEKGLRIRTIGTIEVWIDGVDFAPRLLELKSIGFLWLYLMSREVHIPGDHISRSSLADEVAHGLKPAMQLVRLKGQLYDLRHDLPGALGERLIAERLRVSLSLEGASLDVIQLRELEQRLNACDGLPSPDLAAEIQACLAALRPGEFLPGWEEIERKATGCAGVAGHTIAAVREQVNASRAALAAGLAAACQLHGQPLKAIPHLEDAYRWSNGRENVARLLKAAYHESGQHERASRFDARHRAGEEV